MIVEDDENITLALKMILNSNFQCDRIDTAPDGLTAWGKIQTGDYNLIISDWNMPRMDGNQLLIKIREDKKIKRLPFLMLTVRKDIESVSAAIRSGVTDYVIKPFDKQALIHKIEKLIGKKLFHKMALEEVEISEPDTVNQRAISIKVMEIIGRGEVSLPAMPQVIFAIEDAIKKEDVTIQELSKLIETDAGISSKLMGVANSVFYRGIKECTSVEDAITRLGMQETRHLIYLISNRNLFALKDRRYEDIVEKLYIHSIACGAASHSIAQYLTIPDLYNFFTMGLFHDIGKLLVLQVLSEITKNMRGIDITLTTNIMDSLHNKAGYMLLSKWAFPQTYLLIALNHEDISSLDSPEKELAIVHFSNLFVRKLGFSLEKDDGQNILSTKSAKLLHLNNEMLKKVAEEVNEHVNKIRNIL
jgi:HD-like signal output (HDOD) protein/AmiR/NasT family two-component response regulator